MIRFLCAALLSLLWTTFALAQERITDFETTIDVSADGDMIVTETINIISEGDQIRRGIFRELPRYYTFMGVRQTYQYELLEVQRNQRAEPVSEQRQGNAIVWRIGDANVFLEPGAHRYDIRYRVSDMVRRHDDKDEVYWNATGSYWAFPIERAAATINFPNGSEIIETAAYTGARGSAGSNYTVQQRAQSLMFVTTRALSPGEGLTVAASIEKGVIDPLSSERLRELFWIRNGAAILLGLGGLGLFLFYSLAWSRIGRDPAKPPVFPRYAPPNGYSAAAVHYIHHRMHKGQDALSALVMQLGSEGVLSIKADKKTTTLIKHRKPVSKDGQLLIKSLFPKSKGRVVMDGKPDKVLFKGAMKFLSGIAKAYGRDYYKRNLGWAFLGILASLALVGIVLASPVSKNGPLVIGLFIALAGLNGLFLFLLPAPTRYGAALSSEIEGFKLYLETAEKDRINTANPLGEEPPLMSVDLYERFMPYAIALGVEKPWTKQFEKTLPREAKDYRPSYASGSKIDWITGRGGAPVDFGKTLAKAMTAGVAAAAPVSQSSSSGGFSSGSGGGGFSGGGGGGGGGGGW